MDALGELAGDGTGVDASDAVGPEETIATETSGPETVGPETVSGPPPVTSPSCVDGMYDEVLPDDGASIAALVAGYNQSDYLAFSNAVLAARYPLGAFLVAEANATGAGGLGNCITAFTSNRGTARGLIGQLSTVVHECGHIYDLTHGSFSSDLYQITRDVSFSCNRGDTQTRGGDTFARSRMNGDDFAGLLPGDFYRDVYLDGDPDDGTFDGGDQGFNSVLEEATQYVNSLATDWALRDQLSFSVSARDGILTFLWYIERYLHMARSGFPAAYERLAGDACWREAILTVWGRAWLYLDLTKSIGQLGIDDDTIEALVLLPELLTEIELIRTRHGCP